MTKIDPTKPEYQVSDAFKPDKESAWHYPAEDDGWMLAHNALRGEMQLFRETFDAMIKRKPMKEWELAALKQTTAGHLEHIHAHHSNEDDIFTPEMKKRCNLPEKLEKDHEQLMITLKDMEKCIESLKVGDKVDALLCLWIEYQANMQLHLKEEEEVALPLYRAYFTPSEGAVLVQKVLKKSPKYELGSFIYFAGVEHFRTKFMKQEGIPFFVWYLDFQGKYKQFVNDIITPIEALKTCEEPKPAPARCTVM